ncbi:hypothetical protein D3C77_646880 [compost metagenome]
MTKQELLAFVNSLPEDTEVLPREVTLRQENRDDPSPWESTGTAIGRYRREVEHLVTLSITFKTAEEADFQRTYENPEGSFRNLHQVPR